MRCNINSVVQFQRPTGDPHFDRLPLVVGHDEIQLPVVGFVDLVDGADVRVVQGGGGLGFLEEPLLGRVVLGQIPLRDALGVVAWVAFPYAAGPKDGIGRFRGGIRRPKVAAAFQADPELVELPGFPGAWIREIHERAAALAAHLKIDIAHESILARSPHGASPSPCRAVCGNERVALSPVESSLPTDLRRGPTHSRLRSPKT